MIVTEHAAATAFAPPDGSVPDLEAAGWQLVLDDDFDGPVLDESVWKVHDGPGCTAQAGTHGARSRSTRAP